MNCIKLTSLQILREQIAATKEEGLFPEIGFYPSIMAEMEGDKVINEKKLLDKLQALEKKHRRYADKPGVLNQYQEGYADGIRQAMNEIVGLLDEERLKK